MMALNNTEADSPTNLTINNVCARCCCCLFMIIYSSSASLIAIMMRVCVSVLRIRIARIIMGCLKTVLIKRTKVRARPSTEWWSIEKLVQNHFERYYKWQTNYFTVDLPYIIKYCHGQHFQCMTLILLYARASFDPDAFHTCQRFLSVLLCSFFLFAHHRLPISTRTPTFKADCSVINLVSRDDKVFFSYELKWLRWNRRSPRKPITTTTHIGGERNPWSFSFAVFYEHYLYFVRTQSD